jgi:aminoglycoside 6-adenylyltransferase
LNHDRAIAAIVDWALTDDNIRAAVLTGSVAAGPEHMDELSDLDVELYALDESKLLNDRAWYELFGDVLVVEELVNPGWHPTRLVYYVGGKIDFMIGPIGALASARYDRAFRVLVDKDHLADLGATAAPPVQRRPDHEDYVRCIHWFYAAALMLAKCIARDEPWLAKVRDWDLKRELLQMIEWDHKARYGWTYETWYLGKHMDRWMDPDIRAALDSCWSGFDVLSAPAALFATLDLFETLSERTADALGFEQFNPRAVRDEVTANLAPAARPR